ncbi:MAG: hypothetical protein ACK5NC_07920, partial [Vibrio sp.]
MTSKLKNTLQKSSTQPNFSIEHHPVSYSKDLAKHYFSQIQSKAWAMLLRSAADGHPNNRYDILVANPIVTIQSYAKQNHLTFYQYSADGCIQSNKKETITNDPFALLDQLLDTHLPQVSNAERFNDIPFIGGALGYFGYDLGRCVETMPSLAEHDIKTADM